MPRLLFACLFLALTASLAFGQEDAPGSKDYPGISRMPGYYIREYHESPFDAFEFPVTENRKESKQRVEGRRIDFRYDLKENATMPSQLQVVRNYQNAARSAGGQVLFDTGEATTLRLRKGGSETWCYLEVGNQPSGVFIMMYIVEKQAMQQEVTIDAKAMAREIGEGGRTTIYGVYFDTGKADLKPESAPAITEMANLLAQNPQLKVYVVGHTDMTADAATNVKLSQARAQSVVAALAQRGVAASRMIPYGSGPYAPVASNRTEEGRAKNRRVELVEIATR